MSEPSNGAGEPRAFAPPFMYQYVQGSPCGALVGYTQHGDELTIMTTFRAAHMGGGRSLMAGGFWEPVKMLPLPPETTRDGDVELYREGFEELGEDMKTLIPYEAFHDRAEHVWDGMVRKGTGLGVHVVVQKSIELTDQEFVAIMNMPPTDEQIGKKPETFLLRSFQSAADAESHIRDRLSDFKYPEEVDAVVRLYNKKNKEAERALAMHG